VRKEREREEDKEKKEEMERKNEKRDKTGCHSRSASSIPYTMRLPDMRSVLSNSLVT
jgi:hypothetical protein